MTLTIFYLGRSLWSILPLFEVLSYTKYGEVYCEVCCHIKEKNLLDKLLRFSDLNNHKCNDFHWWEQKCKSYIIFQFFFLTKILKFLRKIESLSGLKFKNVHRLISCNAIHLESDGEKKHSEKVPSSRFGNIWAGDTLFLFTSTCLSFHRDDSITRTEL